MDSIIPLFLDNLTLLVTIVLLFTLLSVWMSVRGKRIDMEKRIERITHRGETKTKRSTEDVSLRRKRVEMKGLAYYLAKPLPDFKTVANRLERAGKHMSAQQYVLRRIFWLAGIATVLHVVLGKSLLVSIGAGVLLGVWLPFKLLKMSIDKQTRAFLKLFPDAIDLIVRGLRSGLPVSESLVVVSQELPDPVGSTFTEVANTMKLGVPLEKALQEMAKKLDITEFNFFTTSIILQRETGGNLAEILNNLSEVLRSRFIMRMKIKAMSSEARASAMIIGALPFVVFALISVISPGYMNVLYDDPRGNVCAGIALGMLTFGLWVMRRMTQFEI
jgi:tight adherence protein B